MQLFQPPPPKPVHVTPKLLPKETKGKSIAKKKDQGKELPSKSDDNPLEAGDYNCILSILIMSKSAIGSPLI